MHANLHDVLEQWHYKGDVSLVGDAAHGVVPYLGLGINVGFEGCWHLSNLIKKHSSPPSPTSSSSPSTSPCCSSCSSCTSSPRPSAPLVDWESVFSEFSQFKISTDVLSNAAVANAYELHKQIKDSHFLFEKEVSKRRMRRRETVKK